MSSRTNNSKSQKRAALAKLRGDKRKRLEGLLSSSEDVLDSAALDEEDIYDVYNEDEYQNLVESRRQREDFVVDDGTFVVVVVVCVFLSLCCLVVWLLHLLTFCFCLI